MIRSAKNLSGLLLLLVVLVLVSPVPITNGVSTLRIIPLLVILAVPIFILRKNLLLDKNILIFNALYLFLVALSFEAMTLDVNYRLMYLSTLIVSFTLPLIKVRELNGNILIGAALIFFTLVLFNADILLTSAFTGGSRIDVLEWQKESAFIYGINKFMMGLFTICVLFLISDIKRLYKFLVAFLYLFLAVFYGSRSHSLIAVILLLTNEIGAIGGNIKIYKNKLIKSGFVIVVSALVIGYLVDYNVVLERTTNLVSNFSASNRWRTYEIFISCMSEYIQGVGVDVLLCTREVTYDLDNSFAFVAASSGIVGLAVFSLLLIWSLVLLYKSGLNAKWVASIYFSMLIILNVDILVYRPVILLPIFIYMLRGGNESCRARI